MGVPVRAQRYSIVKCININNDTMSVCMKDQVSTILLTSVKATATNTGSRLWVSNGVGFIEYYSIPAYVKQDWSSTPLLTTRCNSCLSKNKD